MNKYKTNKHSLTGIMTKEKETLTKYFLRLLKDKNRNILFQVI